MSALDLVNRLDHCRSSGDGKWIARCPSHEDKSPSLSIMEKSDGRVLIHCHAGCGANDVLAAIGLEYDALYPPNLEHYPARRWRAPSETIDSLVVEIAEHDRALGKRLSKSDVERYRQALKRNPPKSDAIVEVAYVMGVVKL